MIHPSTTIAAIATPPGRGGVGILRVSGPKASSIAQQITHRQLTPRYAHFGPFYSPQEEVLDEGIALFFKAPHSFTGEDVLELQGHGGPVVLDELLDSCIQLGATLAKPGEFTERAFMNDKMDLTQAEAIADLINATSKQAARNALHSLQGAFSKKIQDLVEQLTHLRMYVEAAIDFPEEEIDFLSEGKVENDLQAIVAQLDAVFDSAKQGVILREGMKVVIVGKPNAGKSSLLNALSGRDTAIVTDIAGTTRDLLREHIHINGMPLHVTDTAGLRDSPDTVEQIGIERALAEMQQADRILLIVDYQEFTEEKLADWRSLLPQTNADSLEEDKLSVIINKIDEHDVAAGIREIHQLPCLFISAKTGQGLDQLSEHLTQAIGFEGTNEGGFTARRRHLSALQQAQTHLQQAHLQLHSGSGELMADDLHQAQLALGHITGQVSADELLGRIFSSFCIGK